MQKRERFGSRQDDTAPRKGISYQEPSPHFPSLTPRPAPAASQQDLSASPGACLLAAGPHAQGTRSRAKNIGEGKDFMAEVYWKHNIKIRPKKKMKTSPSLK